MCRQFTYLTILCLVFGLILSSTASAELVGWWKFDETSGMTAADSSGNGYDGTLVDDPQWVEGWIDGAVELDGDGDYIDLDISTLVPTLEETTLTIWVNWTGEGGAWQRIIDIGRGTGYYIYVTPQAAAFGNALHVAITAGSGWSEFSSSEGMLATGWHHIAVTNSLSAATMVMYLDGKVVGSMEDVTNFVSGIGEATQSWLGRSQYVADPTFSGILDDFRIYNHVLSEIDLHAIAVMNYQQAWKPDPAEDETDVLLDRKLIWNRGIISDETFELYNEHHVYIGTDFNDVNSATVPTVTITDVNEYTMPFDYDVTYYWRVDEASSLDPNSPVKGEVWSFTTANFIVLEDFEDYNDWEPYTVYLTWIDGYGIATNGSTAGYPAPIFINGEHYVETTIVHGGAQSMPVFYDNTTAGLSEVTRTFNDDWTRDDVVTLTLFYYGDASNAVEPMYVALNGDAVVTHENPRAVLDNFWTRWDILLQDFADQGVDLTNVETMSIGMGDKANPQGGGGTGHVFFDDIRLYRSLPVESEPEPEPVDPGADNLVVYYAFDNNTEDSSDNGLHATVEGNPQFITGLTNYGMAMAFDASFDHLTLPIGPAIASMSDITVACWVDFSNEGGSWQRIWDFGVTPEGDNDPNFYMFVTPRWGTNGQLRFAISTGTETNITGPETLPSGWHHVTATIDSASMTMKLYQDGRLVAEGETPLLPSDLGETNQNFLARSQFAADDFYLGSIDEFRIYDRALTSAEVRYLASK